MERQEFYKKIATYNTPKRRFVCMYKEILLRKNVISILRSHFKNKTVVKYLDIGCGNCSGTKIIVDFLLFEGYNVETTVTDIHHLKRLKIEPKKYYVANYEKKPIKGIYDIITCFEVIEHIYDTDSFLLNVKKNLASGGLVLMSIPNTASWKNRILGVFGYAPSNLEVSLKRFYGIKHLEHFYNRWSSPAGHIRGFTKYSLEEMFSHYKMKKIATIGVENWPFVNIFFNRIPQLATNILEPDA